MTHSELAKQMLEKIGGKMQTEGGEIVNYFSKGYITKKGMPCERWTWNNRMMMLMQGTEDARGYNQWLEVGRRVKKGTHGIVILRPLMAKKVEVDEKTGERKVVEYPHGFGGLIVHPIENTEIIDAAKWEESLKGNVPKQMPPLADVAAKWGVKVFYDGTHRGEFGATDGSSYIRMCTPEESTFFHELAHVAQKKIDGSLKPGQDKEQEIIAELTACVIARIYGIDAYNLAWTYITGYVGSTDLVEVGEWVLRASKKVAKILDLIFQTKAEIDTEKIGTPVLEETQPIAA